MKVCFFFFAKTWKRVFRFVYTTPLTKSKRDIFVADILNTHALCFNFAFNSIILSIYSNGDFAGETWLTLFYVYSK